MPNKSQKDKVQLAQSLETFINGKLQQPLTSKPDPHQLTIGLEHEFFLLDKEQLPATHEQSQAILRGFSEEPGWHIQDVSTSELGKMLNRVSLDHTPGRYTALKYDHHPHLLEIAFSYYSTLHELLDRIQRTFDVLHRVTEKTGTHDDHVPYIHISPDNNRLMSPLQDFVNLRHYRALILKNKTGVEHPEYFNYAAVIAATQTHIGNTAWWNHSGYLNKLYSLEPEMLGWSFCSVSDKDLSNNDLLKKRWEGYSQVFADYPLVGFPQINDCEMSDWVHALLCSPLYGSPKDYWAGLTVWDLGDNPYSSWELFWKSVRDLQIIRPKLFGTLEFRADPSQPNPLSIIRLASLRLGLCSYFLTVDKPTTAIERTTHLREAKTQWWNHVNNGLPKKSDNILSMAIQGLKFRGFKEEIFLENW